MQVKKISHYNLPTLLKRSKWNENKQAPHKVNDVVWILKDTTPRGSWPPGRVMEVYPGLDGQHPVLKVKTEINTPKQSEPSKITFIRMITSSPWYGNECLKDSSSNHLEFLGRRYRPHKFCFYWIRCSGKHTNTGLWRWHCQSPLTKVESEKWHLH